MKKVAVIGAGNVGTTTAYYISAYNRADVVLIDVVEGLAYSRAEDLSYVAPIHSYSSRVKGSNDYAAIVGADVVIHTAGVARKPGMDRMDLLKINVGIANSASDAIKKYAPNALVVVVSNPLDVIALACLRRTGFDSSRVIGMAGVLDSARFRLFIAEALQILPHDIFAMVLGGHGDTMVPLPRYTTVSGIPLERLLSTKKLNELIERTRGGGIEIVNYLKTGSAYYAPAASVAKMVFSILAERPTISPVSAYLKGEYGFSNLYLGVPARLGSGGIEDIVELHLSDNERQQLLQSVEAVKSGITMLDSLE